MTQPQTMLQLNWQTAKYTDGMHKTGGRFACQKVSHLCPSNRDIYTALPYSKALSGR